MSCKHCTLREERSGGVTRIVGEPFGQPLRTVSQIKVDSGGFALHVERRGFDRREHWVYIPVTHCPWCGDELKEGA